jgi:hypothetical protein
MSPGVTGGCHAVTGYVERRGGDGLGAMGPVDYLVVKSPTRLSRASCCDGCCTWSTPSDSMDDTQLQQQQLGELTSRGVLTEAEFAQHKSRSSAPDAGTPMS